eukprot:4591284-Pyramimonas_sp.AAC.1
MNFTAASEAAPSFGWNPSWCVVQYTRGTNVKNARYQRCEHPGFPSAPVTAKTHTTPRTPLLAK